MEFSNVSDREACRRSSIFYTPLQQKLLMYYARLFPLSELSLELFADDLKEELERLRDNDGMSQERGGAERLRFRFPIELSVLRCFLGDLILSVEDFGVRVGVAVLEGGISLTISDKDTRASGSSSASCCSSSGTCSRMNSGSVSIVSALFSFPAWKTAS